MIKSICLIRLSALGDVLMCVPLVRTLQRYLPQASITWVISNPAYALVAGIDGVEFVVIDKPSHLIDYVRIRRRFKGRFFDVLLAAQASFRANLLYACIGAARKIGYDPLRAKDGHGWFIHEHITPGRDHTLDGFLKFAQALGVPGVDLRWDLPINTADTAWVNERLIGVPRPFVVINPAASKPERSWLMERYVAVIDYLRIAFSMTVVLTGGPSAEETRLGEAIAACVPVINLIGQTRLPQLLAVVRAAALVICPDTGPSHMAVAVGTPVIALHAVTNVAISGPYTRRDDAIDRYPDALMMQLGQTVDECVWGKHVHGFDAMKLISVDAVISRIQWLLPQLIRDGHKTPNQEEDC